jgi:hypothetical protein
MADESPNGLPSTDPAPAEREWFEIVMEQQEAKRQIYFEDSKAWLFKNPNDESAGELLNRLFLDKFDSDLVDLAKSWLFQYPRNKWNSFLLSSMLRVSPSAGLVEMAEARIREMRDKEGLHVLIPAILKASPSEQTLELLNETLEQNPHENFWSFSLMLIADQLLAEEFCIKWLRLNRHNSSISFSLCHFAEPSPQILSAAFDWMHTAGRNNSDMPISISRLIDESSRRHEIILSAVLSFAREWLSDNPDNEESGKIYGSILRSTESRVDIKKALNWYLVHRDNESAWRIIADLLAIAFWRGAQPNRFAVDEAKRLLREAEYRIPLLIGNLISVWADEESIAWAKDLYKRERVVWVLVRLVGIAPDAESTELLLDVLKQSDDADDLGEMLSVLLKATPNNELVKWRARSWLKKNPDHSFFCTIKELMAKQ